MCIRDRGTTTTNIAAGGRKVIRLHLTDLTVGVSGLHSGRTGRLSILLTSTVVDRGGSYIAGATIPVSYTHLRAHETPEHLVCRLLLEKKKKNTDTLRYYIFK
eukprot:TRINITY_DN42841_c0_g1_i1.p1 TRINITY_DN42841_c0_g1~~TRINITY_DN42841_c0_g1_i1.p1  ORF type:complete len:103 (+),score=13.43 TRINITY_DN42841_c0_g1_i1:184-492(+)